MGFYHLDLDALSKWANEPVEGLKTRSYGELEELIAKMRADKIKKNKTVGMQKTSSMNGWY